MDSIQLGASALAIISAAMAFALAWLSWHFAKRRHVLALRDVAVAWIALGVAALVRPLEVTAAAGLAGILLDIGTTLPSFVHLGFMVLGATALLQDDEIGNRRRRDVLVSATLATAMTVALSLLAVKSAESQAMVRVGVRAAATALACVAIANVVMRAPADGDAEPSFGAGIVRGALLVASAAAAWQAGTAMLASRMSPSSATWAMVLFVEFVAQCGVAVGLVVWILDREVARANAMAASAEHRAATDPLTGLPNRARILDRVAMALANARRDNEVVAVCYVDLDDFKRVNDDHGHAAGDTVLRAVAQRLVGALRAPDTVGRIGGDEFVVVTPRLRSRDDVPIVVARIRQALRGEVDIGNGTMFPVDGSVGAAIFPDAGADVDLLLAAADDALYRDKTVRRGERWTRLAARSA